MAWDRIQRDIDVAKLDWAVTPLVFVYGTLKKGWGNNRLLESSEFVGSFTTEDNKFYLEGRGCPFVYPPHVCSDDTVLAPVAGEIWKTDTPETLRRLDRLEGHPDGYYRTLLNHSQGLCWIYVIPERLNLNPTPTPLVNGVYKWQR